jgi:serine/threonine protein kinase/outer membrane biosynthesis protein TonB
VVTDSNAFGAEAEPERYQLVQELASGGMATVYLARTRGPDDAPRIVAVKRIHRHLAREKAFLEMFFDEARIATRIKHPNVCAVFDFGGVGGTFFIAMEYVLGETLMELVHEIARDRELRLSRRWQSYMAAIAAEACDGLHAVHELCDDQGRPMHVVHRDVSPSNVFVTYEGGVKVVDFGIAFAEEKVHHTKTGTLKGNLGYMSPELISGDGRNVDRLADVWGLGVCLWELLAGEALFRARSEAATVLNVMQRPVQSLQAISQVPAALDAIVGRALDRDRNRRYPTAEALGRDLRGWIASTEESVDAAEIAEFMQTRFAPQYARKLDVLELAQTATGAVPLEQLSEEPVTNVLPIRAPSGPRFESAELIRPSVPRELPLPPLPAVEMTPPPALPVTVPPPGPAPAPRRRRWIPLSIALAGAALALGATAILWQGQGEPAGPALSVADEHAPAVVSPPVEPAAVPPPVEPAVVPPPDEAPPDEAPPVEAPPVEAPPDEAPPVEAPPDEPKDERPARSGKQRRGKSPRHEPRRRRGGDGQRRPARSTTDDDVDDSDSSSPELPEPTKAPEPIDVPDSPADREPDPPVDSKPPVTRPPKRTGPLAAAVRIRSLTVQGSLVNSMVSRGIDRVSSSLRECYREAAVGAGKNASGSVHVTVSIDENGKVDRATATGGPLPGIDECVRRAAMKIRTLHRPDVGGASAKFDVNFTPKGE